MLITSNSSKVKYLGSHAQVKNYMAILNSVFNKKDLKKNLQFIFTKEAWRIVTHQAVFDMQVLLSS